MRALVVVYACVPCCDLVWKQKEECRITLGVMTLVNMNRLFGCDNAK